MTPPEGTSGFISSWAHSVNTIPGRFPHLWDSPQLLLIAHASRKSQLDDIIQAYHPVAFGIGQTPSFHADKEEKYNVNSLGL